MPRFTHPRPSVGRTRCGTWYAGGSVQRLPGRAARGPSCDEATRSDSLNITQRARGEIFKLSDGTPRARHGRRFIFKLSLKSGEPCDSSKRLSMDFESHKSRCLQCHYGAGRRRGFQLKSFGSSESEPARAGPGDSESESHSDVRVYRGLRLRL